MSSESISPASFYSMRGFGYKRFEKTEPNNLDNCIILYEKYPNFNINDKELENYPMIIEIDTKTIKEDTIQEHEDGVFYAEKTIYLNPISAKIYFRNESEKRSTLSKAEPSIETKMLPLYQSCFNVRPKGIECFDWTKSNIKDSENDNTNHISEDRKINKLKGFLYAYILAANKLLSDEVVTLKKYAKDLRNTLSAVITSPDGRATYKQQNQLDKIYESINNAFYKAEGLDKKLKELITQKKEQWHCENFLEILQGESLYDFWIQKQNIKSSFQLRSFYVSSSKAEDKEKSFENYMLDLENAITEFNDFKFIQKEQFPILQDCNKIEPIPIEKGDFLTKLLNEHLNDAYNSETFILSRYKFAKDIVTNTFKKELGEKWNSSSTQTYLNNLLLNLDAGQPFELNSTAKPILKSFAAFCQKGNADIDKLEDYLISNEIGDFCIAFALWGIVFGFANMPKTLTNELFLLDNLDYISEIYKYVFEQVHGIELKGTLERRPEISTMNKETNKNDVKIHQFINDNTTCDSFSELEKKLRPCKLKQEQLESIQEGYKQNKNQFSKPFFDYVKKIKGIRGKKLQQIKECLGYIEQQEIKSTAIQSSIYSLESDFNKNVKSDNIIDKLICFNGKNKDIINRLKENWDYVNKKNLDKKETIRFFINLCKKEGEGRATIQTALLQIFTKEVANKCEIELEDIL